MRRTASLNVLESAWKKIGRRGRRDSFFSIDDPHFVYIVSEFRPRAHNVLSRVRARASTPARACIRVCVFPRRRHVRSPEIDRERATFPSCAGGAEAAAAKAAAEAVAETAAETAAVNDRFPKLEPD